MNDFDKELFRLKTFYNFLVQLLNIHFSGYFLSSSNETNKIYLKLCFIIENILKQKEFETLSSLPWKPFDNLLAVDSDTDLEWEYGKRKICADFQSEIEKLFIQNGEKQFELDESDKIFISSILNYLSEYQQQKDYEPKQVDDLIDSLKPYFQSTPSPEKDITQKSDEKLLKLQHQIEEAKLEAERRKAVLESKNYGAQIEIITELRNELKRKNETAREIQELNSRLTKLENLFSTPQEQLVENIYRPLYDQIMGIYQSRNFITFVPDNPWEKILPSWKLKTENDIKQLCENYSKELGIWYEMWIDFGNKSMEKRDNLGEILKPVFEKHGLLDERGYVRFGTSSNPPKDWLHYVQNVIFNSEIQGREALYQILREEVRRRYGELSQQLEEWHQNKPELFTDILKIIPDLVKGLGAKYSYAEIDKQREILKESIEKLTLALEEKLK